jgi:hypothetical protein
MKRLTIVCIDALLTLSATTDAHAAGQRAFDRRARFNGAATVGKYTHEMEAAPLGIDDPPHRRDGRDD